MSPPAEIKAVVIGGPGSASVQTVPLPKLRDDYILVRTTAVALNPTDWKHVQGIGNNIGSRVGCDYAGIVEEVGPKVTKSFAKGDRICGPAHGSNQSQLEDGTFAEYIVVKGDVQIKIPDNLSDEEASTLGIGITTVGQGLYQALALPLPNAPSSTPFPILIYGGSTATGILGIQFAKLSGLRVATTSSPRNFDLVKSLGADAVFDYNSPTCAADIKAWSGGELRHAWDCIGVEKTARLCVSAMSAEGGAYRSLLRVDDAIVKDVNPNVSSGFTFAYTVFGEPFVKFIPTPAVPADFEFGKMFWELSRQLLAEGKVKTAKPDVNRGGKGLEGVLVGLEELKEDKVSGAKLVYTL